MSREIVSGNEIKMRGLFISVEGIDGAGKSTHVDFIATYLRDRGFQVVLTREPGGTELGEKVRDILLHGAQDMHRITELCLLFASRQELISKVIEPNLAQGICVIADRFIDASVAYQGYGRNIGQDKMAKIIDLLEPKLTTDLTFLFDAPLSLAISRVLKNRNKDRIESESVEFFTTVQNAYRMIATQEPDRIKIIETNHDIEFSRRILVRHLDCLIRQKEAEG